MNDGRGGQKERKGRKLEINDIPAMHFSVVVSHETGAQQACVAEQSAPSTLGPAVHWALSAEETEVGPLGGIEAMEGEECGGGTRADCDGGFDGHGFGG